MFGDGVHRTDGEIMRFAPESRENIQGSAFSAGRVKSKQTPCGVKEEVKAITEDPFDTSRRLHTTSHALRECLQVLNS